MALITVIALLIVFAKIEVVEAIEVNHLFSRWMFISRYRTLVLIIFSHKRINNNKN